MAAVLLVTTSAAALANDESSPADNGLMVFPNVLVINAPAADVSATTVGSAGMRAQKDRATGELRMPTAAEAAELDALTPAADEEAVVARAAPGGGYVAELTSAHLSYSVVRKNEDGQLVQDCVTGESAADHALHNHAVIEEVRNDR
jgi:hypothetical protein